MFKCLTPIAIRRCPSPLNAMKSRENRLHCCAQKGRRRSFTGAYRMAQYSGSAVFAIYMTFLILWSLHEKGRSRSNEIPSCSRVFWRKCITKTELTPDAGRLRQPSWGAQNMLFADSVPQPSVLKRGLSPKNSERDARCTT